MMVSLKVTSKDSRQNWSVQKILLRQILPKQFQVDWYQYKMLIWMFGSCWGCAFSSCLPVSYLQKTIERMDSE